MQTTAVVFINFNRPDLTTINLERIVEANPRKIYFVIDGPREGNFSDNVLVGQTKQIASRVPNHIPCQIIASTVNLGPKLRIESALDEVFSKEPQAIVIEDDCFVEPDFFWFASKALLVYRDNPAVGVISAHRPVSGHKKTEIYADEFPRIWGWATWADRWIEYRRRGEPDLANPHVRNGALARMKSRTARFMASQLFNREISEKNWDIPFQAHLLLHNQISITPPRNAVSNLGLVGGTNSHDWAFIELPSTKPIPRALKFKANAKRGYFEAAIEDIIRLSKWAFYSLTRPGPAARKLMSLLPRANNTQRRTEKTDE